MNYYFEISKAYSISNKIDEMTFFMEKLILLDNMNVQSETINTQELNFYFSAFLNAIQSIKDAVVGSMKEEFPWATLSPRWGDFMFFCRNAVTHDGTELINASKDGRSYIVGPLVRRDKRNDLIRKDAPALSVADLVVEIVSDVVASVSSHADKHSNKVVVSNEPFSADSLIQFMESTSFVPPEIVEMLKDNAQKIENEIGESDRELDFHDRIKDSIGKTRSLISRLDRV